MQKLIIGREAECKVFEEAMHSQGSEFVAITGRRRIGKTFLVNQYFGPNMCFYLTGVQDQPQGVQLQAFAQELGRRQNEFVAAPKNWLEAFDMLRKHVEKVKSKEKKVIFMDELPWMDTPKSNFVQIFAHFWNSWAAWTKDIVLVIAGSSTSWIVNKVYNDVGGLHNRVTKRIWLKPFTLKQTEVFLESKNLRMSRYEIALLYMAMGGVPFYLNEVKTGESAAQTIQRLFFENGGLLKSEFQNLYQAIFHKADAYIRVVKVLAKHRYGLHRTELLKKAKITNSGGGSKIIEDLVLTGYVDEMLPFGKKKSGSKYVLNDLYSLFYLSFVEGNSNQNWITLVQSASYKTWCGLTFERLCFLHKDEIHKALGINGIYTQTRHLSIYDDTKKAVAQIDMLIERSDNVFNLCEIKFSNEIFVLSEAEAVNIRKKMSSLRSKIKSKQSIYPTLITTYGAERNMHYLGLVQNDVILDDLFSKT
jgi:uncharacterized protein